MDPFRRTLCCWIGKNAKRKGRSPSGRRCFSAPAKGGKQMELMEALARLEEEAADGGYADPADLILQKRGSSAIWRS